MLINICDSFIFSTFYSISAQKYMKINCFFDKGDKKRKSVNLVNVSKLKR